MELFEKEQLLILEKCRNLINSSSVYSKFEEYLDEINKDIATFQATGDFYTAVKIKKERSTEQFSGTDDGLKENTGINNEVSSRDTTKRSTKSTRSTRVLTDAKINGRIRNMPPIKLEKISEDSNDAGVKTEMLPPQEPIKRTRKAKKDNSTVSDASSNSGRDSDIILQKPKISIVDLTDSVSQLLSSDAANITAEISTRSTRTKTKFIDAAAQKSDLASTLEPRSTRTKTLTKKKSNLLDAPRQTLASNSKYVESNKNRDGQISDDNEELSASDTNTESIDNKTFKVDKDKTKRPHSQIMDNDDSSHERTSKRQKSSDSESKDERKAIDTTVVIEKRTVGNDTVIIQKSDQILVTTPLNKKIAIDDFLTDDEDDCVATKVKEINKAKTGPKPIFSAFENSPVKKKVEAFEKLGAELAAADAPRMTRTKTKAKQAEKEIKKTVDGEISPKPVIKEKGKAVLTPLNSNRFFSPLIKTSNAKDAPYPAKPLSAFKAAHVEFIDWEMRNKEKEAMRKKEALLQAKTDESKRKRQEKQLKAQQIRIAMEKDKQKMLEEAEKIKMEKHKQILVEKTEKMQKQREGAELKRIAAAKKAQEEKRKEEERKLLEKQKEISQKKTVPIYLLHKPPLLPTEDCYDSDDERTNAVRAPDWTKWTNMNLSLKNQYYSGDKGRNTFFMCAATTPNLQDIFEKINPGKLKRTSSAVWHKAPRFTLMPIPQEEDD